MVKIIFAFVFFFETIFLVAQSKDDTKIMLSYQTAEPYVFPFTIENNTLNGAGGLLLKDIISETQFFVLGETHNSSQTSKLTNTLLPILFKNGYKNFALETGPVSTKILKRLSEVPKNTSDKLYNFNTKYQLPNKKGLPIPFFSGKEDATFLATAADLGFDLWGLDQEYLYAVPHLIDELYNLIENDISLLPLKNEVEAILSDYYHKEAADVKNFKLFDSLSNNENINDFFEEVLKQKPQANEIIDALKISWDIYSRNMRWGAFSHLTRVSYLRNNFLKNYKNAGENAKVFIKIGGLHAGKDKELNAYDIGNLTFELADRRNTKSINIHIIRRYYQTKKGKVKDYWTTRDKNISLDLRYFGKKDQWVLIDLSELNEKIKNHQLELPQDISFHFLKRYIQNYDILLIPPLDKKQEPNYYTKDNASK